LLLKGHDEAKSATGKDLAIYGQENDLATWALAKMNMFLHDSPSAEIWKGNTLSSPHFTEKGGLNPEVVRHPCPCSVSCFLLLVLASDERRRLTCYGAK
jgi:hypothetical protein